MEGDLEESIPGPSRGVRPDPQPFQSDVDLIPRSVPNLNPLQLRKKKISAIRQLLYRDPKALDIKWSLFITALQSYKYDSLLKPFPPEFIINGTKDINYLRQTTDKVPDFRLLKKHLAEPDFVEKKPEVIDLIYWVVLQLKDYKLESIPKSQFDSVLGLAKSITPVKKPDLIFELSSNHSSPSESKWQALARGRNCFYAYHGSKLENFHSIINYGLQQHFNKNSLFGQGIYLSSELSVSLSYSPNSYSWGRSMLGSQLSCVALCEIIDHPDVKCQEGGPERARAQDSLGGEVPKKYYVVINSDLVRIRYLLIYAKQMSQYTRSRNSNSLINWLKDHKMLVLILGYIFLLTSIGLSNDKNFLRFFNTLSRKLNFYN